MDNAPFCRFYTHRAPLFMPHEVTAAVFIPILRLYSCLHPFPDSSLTPHKAMADAGLALLASPLAQSSRLARDLAASSRTAIAAANQVAAAMGQRGGREWPPDWSRLTMALEHNACWMTEADLAAEAEVVKRGTHSRIRAQVRLC